MPRKVGLAALLLAVCLALPAEAQQTFTWGNDYSKLNYLPTSSTVQGYRPPGPQLPSMNLMAWVPNVSMTQFLPTWGRLGLFSGPQTTFVPGAQAPKTP